METCRHPEPGGAARLRRSDHQPARSDRWAAAASAARASRRSTACVTTSRWSSGTPDVQVRRRVPRLSRPHHRLRRRRQRHAGGAERRGAGQHRQPVPRPLQPGHLEPGAAVAADHGVVAGFRQLRRQGAEADLRRLAPGRHHAVLRADAQRRRALRPRGRRLRQLRRQPALLAERPSAGHRQHRTARRAGLPEERPALVFRGGYGVYYGTVQNGYFTVLPTQTTVPVFFNDGRADFASNPYNGPTPSYETVTANACTPAMLTGCYIRNTQQAVYWPNNEIPYSHQASGGLQWQVGERRSASRPTTCIRARRHVLSPYGPNANLTFNPETGLNYPASDASAPRVALVGHGVAAPDRQPLELPLDAHGADQAAERPLAAVGHLYAVRPVGCLSAAVQRRRPSHQLPGVARNRRRIQPGRRRPTPSRGDDRHLAPAARVPARRHVFLRLRRALRHAVGHRRAAGRADAGRRRHVGHAREPHAARRVDRSRATASSASRFIASTCGCSGASPSAGA